MESREVDWEIDRQDPNHVSSAIIARPTDKVINVNISYDDMTRPVAGPQDPFNNQKNKGMNSISGQLIVPFDQK